MKEKKKTQKNPTYISNTIIYFFWMAEMDETKVHWYICQAKLFISFLVISFQATSGYSPDGH